MAVRDGMGMVSVESGARGVMFPLGPRRRIHNKRVKRQANVARRREGQRLCNVTFSVTGRGVAETDYCEECALNKPLIKDNLCQGCLDIELAQREVCFLDWLDCETDLVETPFPEINDQYDW